LWDTVLRIGAINHFLLPKYSGSDTASPRYGDIAIGETLNRLWQLGCRQQDLVAKIFGGACVLEAFREREHHLGWKNVEIAQEQLAAAAIPIVAQDIGGQRGRKLIFRSDDGSAWVKQL
jgi:chemotaxis protein CheD